MMRWSTLVCALSLAYEVVHGETAVEASGSSQQHVPDLTGSNFTSTVSKDQWFVKFFSPYCPHCITLAPYWERAGEKYKDLASTQGFHLASVDCIANGDLCQEQNIRNFPTMYLYKDGVKIDEYLNIGAPDPLVPISAFIDKHTSSREADQKVEKDGPRSTSARKQTKPTAKVATEPKFIQKAESSRPLIVADKSSANPMDDRTAASLTDEQKPQAKPLLESDFTSEKQATFANPSGTSVELTSETFTKLVTNTQETWFLKFYAPWCSHCKAMAHAWTELANDFKGRLNIGEVNCEAEPRLCKDIGVRGYPTLLFFQGEEHIEYSGLRGLGDLIAFSSKAATASIKDVDAAEFEAVQKKEEVIFLYFYDSGTTSEDFEALRRTALQLIGHAPLLKTSSSILASRFRATTFPKLMVIRDERPQYYTALGPSDMRDHLKILAWMKSAWLPIVPELSAENSHEIMQNRLVVLAALDPNDPEFEEQRALLKTVAQEYTDQRASEDQAEKQTQRDKKQSKIEDAEKKGDTRAVENAKGIHVTIPDKQDIGFAWVNGLFWEKWLSAAYSVDLSKSGPKVIINDEDRKRYWDTDTKGQPIALVGSAILDTLSIVVSNPSKIKSKSTKNTLEAAYYAARRAGTGHPWLISFLLLCTIMAVVFIMTRGKRQHSVSLGVSDRERGPFLGNGKYD